jgi:hypothetical protein
MKQSRLLLSLIAMLLSGFLFSQNEPTKEHFIITKNSSDIDVEKYAAAANSGFINLDAYRFYDKRRVINFTGTDATIELYSAKEMKEKYGKIVPAETIMPGQDFKEITFSLTLDGKSFKPQLK